MSSSSQLPDARALIHRAGRRVKAGAQALGWKAKISGQPFHAADLKDGAVAAERTEQTGAGSSMSGQAAERGRWSSCVRMTHELLGVGAGEGREFQGPGEDGGAVNPGGEGDLPGGQPRAEEIRNYVGWAERLLQP